MRRAASFFAAFTSLVAIPQAASACVIMLYEQIEPLIDVRVEGRYFQAPDNPALGYVYVDRRNDGVWDRRYVIHWDLVSLEDPLRSQCMTSIPSQERYSRFGLRALPGGGYEILSSSWVEDPNDPNEVNE